MSTYPNLNNDPQVSRIKTKDDKIRDIKYKIERHDHKKVLKSLYIVEDYFRNKYKILNKKKILLIVTEILIGGSSTKPSSTLSIFIPSFGIVISSSTPLLTSIAILFTNEDVSKLKIRYTKLRDSKNVITLLYEKNLKQSMIDKTIDEKEAQEPKKIYNHYLDKKNYEKNKF